MYSCFIAESCLFRGPYQVTVWSSKGHINYVNLSVGFFCRATVVGLSQREPVCFRGGFPLHLLSAARHLLPPEAEGAQTPCPNCGDSPTAAREGLCLYSSYFSSTYLPYAPLPPAKSPSAAVVSKEHSGIRNSHRPGGGGVLNNLVHRLKKNELLLWPEWLWAQARESRGISE